MATVPLSGTNIRILSGIPFSNDYKHTRWFDSLSEQTSYFLGKPVIHSMSEANFQRIEGRAFVRVNRSIDELWGANYLMFQNAQYNNKWFYAFITKLEYVNAKVTHVHFQIDVLQTWLFDMIFKPSFVIREHRPLWNSDGTPVINTVDEGLHYGTDYEIVSVERFVPYDDIFFLVAVTKKLMHGSDKGIEATVNGLPQPLSYYVHPIKLDGSSPEIIIGDHSFGISSGIEFLRNIFTQEDAVNNIVSLYITEYIGFKFSKDGDALIFPEEYFSAAVIADDVHENVNTIYVKKNSYQVLNYSFGNKYDGYRSVKESKLLMYPYTCIILTDLKGSHVVLKNEYIEDDNLRISVRGSLGPSNKVSYEVDNYLVNSSVNGEEAGLVTYENALVNNNPNDLPIMNDYLAAFMQGHRNTIENQRNSIVFNGLMNMIGNAVGGAAAATTRNIGGVLQGGVGVVQGAGNTLLQIQGIEAKLADIANVPPSLVKMGGNTNFDYGNDFYGIFIIKKQITQEYQRKLEDFFNMYGYKVNEVKVPNFHTRRYWNYVQTADCVIRGNFNNEDLEELKQIFNNGITLWHTDDIGNYTLDNEVI